MRALDVTKLANIIPGIQLPPGKADLPNIVIPKTHSKRRKKVMSRFHDIVQRCVPSQLEVILNPPSLNDQRRNGKAPTKARKVKERRKSK